MKAQKLFELVCLYLINLGYNDKNFFNRLFDYMAAVDGGAAVDIATLRTYSARHCGGLYNEMGDPYR